MTGRAVLTMNSPDERARAKACEHCGRVFARDPRNTWAYFAKAKYCSRGCFGQAHAKNAAAKRPSLADMFASKISKSDGCWPWMGLVDKDGYGLFQYAKKMRRAPRVALELDGRPVPAGMYACHHCDNPICVRPDHLYPGTPTQNVNDAIRRGRMSLGDRAKLTESDVIAIRSARGTQSEIAEKFNIARSNVSLIRSRRTWRHVL